MLGYGEKAAVGNRKKQVVLIVSVRFELLTEVAIKFTVV
jgi:hypothetical protein